MEAPAAAPKARKSRLDRVTEVSCVKMKNDTAGREPLTDPLILEQAHGRTCQTPVKSVQ
jgi:hypothetical protein